MAEILLILRTNPNKIINQSIDLHHGQHHDVVGPAVDVAFLHDDVTDGDAAVRVGEVHFL